MNGACQMLTASNGIASRAARPRARGGVGLEAADAATMPTTTDSTLGDPFRRSRGPIFLSGYRAVLLGDYDLQRQQGVAPAKCGDATSRSRRRCGTCGTSAAGERDTGPVGCGAR